MYQLTEEKRTGKTPPNRMSWKGAVENVRGNISWALSFMEPEEIVAIIASECDVSATPADGESLQQRHLFLQLLIALHQEAINDLETSKTRLENVMVSDTQDNAD